MKFRSDITQGGYKILSLHGPDEFDCYSGVVEADGSFIGLNWGRKGEELECQSEYDLIPLADEPKPDHTAVTDKLQYALDMCMDKLHDLDQRLALEMKRNDELERQQEWESDEIACWLDSAAAKEILWVWVDLDRDTDITTDKVIEMLWNGENAKAWLKQRVQELAEKQYDTWKHSSKLAYKVAK